MSNLREIKDQGRDRADDMLRESHCRHVGRVPLVRILIAWERCPGWAREVAAELAENSAGEKGGSCLWSQRDI
jgi:hypothetical protein